MYDIEKEIEEKKAILKAMKEANKENSIKYLKKLEALKSDIDVFSNLISSKIQKVKEIIETL